ncbi:hypothetical protein B0H19DRAFT_153732 [Mycena capillaripes]|nr:hypothetical protein B0H19DRAFT_153732 [Mycena capillaripes]
MEDQLHVDDEFTTSETINNTGSACYAGGIFPGSQQFTVAGGTFTSINKHYNTAPMVPSDFRMIPLGDVDLQHAISAGDVDRNYERARVRKVYSARIDGRMSNMTVAMYQGNGAEEEWQEDIARYMSIRHPNILQIYGAASSCNVHATIFHGDLIPFRHFLDLHRHSPLLTVYIYAYAIKEFGV